MKSLYKRAAVWVAVLLIQISIAEAKDLAIINARIEVGDGTVIQSGTVLIHDGKIMSVGPDVVIPAGTETMDAKGMVVYPGFVDAYATSGLKIFDPPSGGTPPDTRTTAPATMWHENRKGVRLDVIAAKSLDLKSHLKEAHAQGITTALLTAGTGGVIRGVASVVDLTDSGNVLLPNAAEELSFRGGGGGGGGGGAGSSTYPGTLFGYTALLRQTLYDAQTASVDTSAKPNAAYANLAPLMRHEVPALVIADTSREISRAARLGDEFGFRVILVGGKEAYRVADFVKAKNFGVIVSPDLGTQPDAKAGTAIDSSPQEVVDERRSLWTERSQNIKKLNDAGIPFAFSTLGLTGLDDYMKSVRTVIAAGLPRDAALKALTSSPAAMLGVSDKVGTIAVGKFANLVLMNGDFADANTHVQTVFIEGSKVDVAKGGSK